MPIYDAQDKIVYGKVRMLDRTPLPGLAAIEAVCGGIIYPVGFADSEGNFRLVLANGGPRFSFPSIPGDLSVLRECEFRAQLPGFQSQHISPNWVGEFDGSTTSIGNILLSRPGAEQQAPHQMDAPIPKTAKNAYKRGGAALASGRWSEAKSVRKSCFLSAWLCLRLDRGRFDRGNRAALA